MEKTQSYQNIFPTRIAARWLFWLVFCTLGILALITLVIIFALRQPPDFYQQVVLDSAEAELLTRRMISKTMALGRVRDRSGPWHAVIQDREINAWLLVDVPKNHSDLLPKYIDSPRIQFGSGHIAIGTKMYWGFLSTTIWCRAEVWLQGVNQVVVKLLDAGAGGIPVPLDFYTRHLSSLLTDIGLTANLQRMNGRLVLCLTPSVRDGPSTTIIQLEKLAVESGELLMAGHIQDQKKSQSQ